MRDISTHISHSFLPFPPEVLIESNCTLLWCTFCNLSAPPLLRRQNQLHRDSLMILEDMVLDIVRGRSDVSLRFDIMNRISSRFLDSSMADLFFFSILSHREFWEQSSSVVETTTIINRAMIFIATYVVSSLPPSHNRE